MTLLLVALPVVGCRALLLAPEPVLDDHFHPPMFKLKDNELLFRKT